MPCVSSHALTKHKGVTSPSMKSYHGKKDLNIRDCALKGS